MGTNSIRCIVVEVQSGNRFRVLDDEKATVRLGENLGEGGKISPAAWERALENLERMRKIVAGYGVDIIEAVATSAVRRASNGGEFVTGLAQQIEFDQFQAALQRRAGREFRPWRPGRQ